MRFLKYVDKYSGSWLPWRWSGRSERVSAASRSMAISSRPFRRARADAPGALPARSRRSCARQPGRARGTAPVRKAPPCTKINTFFFAMSVLSLVCKHSVSCPLNSTASLGFQEKFRIVDHRFCWVERDASRPATPTPGPVQGAPRIPPCAKLGQYCIPQRKRICPWLTQNLNFPLLFAAFTTLEQHLHFCGQMFFYWVNSPVFGRQTLMCNLWFV